MERRFNLLHLPDSRLLCLFYLAPVNLFLPFRNTLYPIHGMIPVNEVGSDAVQHQLVSKESFQTGMYDQSMFVPYKKFHHPRLIGVRSARARLLAGRGRICEAIWSSS